MPHFADASKYPPHPSDAEVRTAHLQRLSLAKLKCADADESNALFEACSTTGFFAIDLTDEADGKKLFEAANDVFGIAEDFYDLDVQEKVKYASPSGKPLLGYKAVGVGKMDGKGTPDRCEIYGISKDDVLCTPSNSPLPQPACLSERRDKFAAFIFRSHKIVEVVLSHLDHHLGLPQGSLASRQRLEERSANQVRMIKAEPPTTPVKGATFVPHTDVGTVTVLFNILGGLQILPPGGRMEVEEDWEYVRPAPGCAIINLGDAMVKWTNGVLRSNMHRAAFPPGKQGQHTRFSIAYFARPEAQVLMKALDESELVRSFAREADNTDDHPFTAEQWETQKGKALYLGLNKPASSGGLRTCHDPMVQALESKDFSPSSKPLATELA